MVSPQSLLVMTVVAYALTNLIDAIVPSTWINWLNQILKGHAEGVLFRIGLDVKKERNELLDKRLKMAIGAVGIVVSVLLKWGVDFLKPASLELMFGEFLLVSLFLLACCGFILLFLPIGEILMTLLFAVPVYLFFLFVAKCKKGAVFAYSCCLSLTVFGFQWMSIAS